MQLGIKSYDSEVALRAELQLQVDPTQLVSAPQGSHHVLELSPEEKKAFKYAAPVQDLSPILNRAVHLAARMSCSRDRPPYELYFYTCSRTSSAQYRPCYLAAPVLAPQHWISPLVEEAVNWVIRMPPFTRTFLHRRWSCLSQGGAAGCTGRVTHSLDPIILCVV